MDQCRAAVKPSAEETHQGARKAGLCSLTAAALHPLCAAQHGQVLGSRTGRSESCGAPWTRLQPGLRSRPREQASSRTRPYTYNPSTSTPLHTPPQDHCHAHGATGSKLEGSHSCGNADFDGGHKADPALDPVQHPFSAFMMTFTAGMMSTVGTLGFISRLKQMELAPHAATLSGLHRWSCCRAVWRAFGQALGRPPFLCLRHHAVHFVRGHVAAQLRGAGLVRRQPMGASPITRALPSAASRGTDPPCPARSSCWAWPSSGWSFG